MAFRCSPILQKMKGYKEKLETVFTAFGECFNVELSLSSSLRGPSSRNADQYQIEFHTTAHLT